MTEHKYKSVLQFEKYIVREIHYLANESYTACDDSISVDFDFDTQSYFSEDNKRMEVELCAYIFNNAEKKNYPFEMSVKIKGFFCLETEDQRIQDFETNAVAILFPFIRAIVSTYTVNANIAPVILPPMNINAYLREKNSRKDKWTTTQ